MLDKIKALPHLLFLKRSVNRTVIEKDMFRWLQVYCPELSKNSKANILIWLLTSHPEFRNLFYSRIGRYSSVWGRVLLFIARRLYKPIETLAFSEPLNIGPGFFIRYGCGTIIGHKSIGENCWINPGVTLGYKNGAGGLPTIGNNVYIGAGAIILGEITIGDNAVIGANAVLTKSVPPNCTVGGVPAHIIKRDGLRVKEILSSPHHSYENVQ